MKKTVLLAYTALLIGFLPPLLAPDRLPAPPGESPTPAVTAAPAKLSEPPERRLRLLVGEEVRELALEDYLQGVLAAEMPASFPAEALKAQAVAARTYALYCAAAKKHGQADLCADYRCCQAWQQESEQREKWGADYEAYAEKLRRAVAETAGEYLSYEGEPVFAAFHASSAGATEDCGRVWNPRPYLISVPSPESAETVPGYVSQVDCAPLDFRDTVLSACPQADFSGPVEYWLGELRLDESGRVDTAVLGGQEIPGTKLRSLFSLRSTAFTLSYSGGRFLFTVTGSGHGVGMSQYGAKVMAEAGEGYRDILSHYYPGTTLQGPD